VSIRPICARFLLANASGYHARWPRQLTDIQSSQEELQDYYAQLGVQHVTPAWIGGDISLGPRSGAVPYLWHWRDLRPQAMRAAELVGGSCRIFSN